VRLIAYYRVSTDRQGESGLGLEAQKVAVRAHAALSGAEIVREVVEVASAKNVHGRALLSDALEAVRAGEAEGLIAAKLDRISRSSLDFATILDDARRHGWTLVVIDIGLDLSTPMGEAMAGMASVFAQLERRTIGERTRVALDAARARGVVLGRPVSVAPGTVDRILELRGQGLTFAAIAKVLNTAGVPASRDGRQWWPSTVRKVALRG